MTAAAGTEAARVTGQVEEREAAAVDLARETLEWDEACPGLALRRRPDAAPRWVVIRREEGRPVRRTLGPVAAMSREVARLLAAGDAKTLEALRASREAVTLDDFAGDFLADCGPSWKPSTLKSNADALRRRILPTLGTLRLDRIGREAVEAWLAAHPLAPATARRDLAVLSGMMRHAALLGLRRADDNPCKGLRKRRSGFRARYLDAEGYRRLSRVLDDLAESFPVETALIRFLALTGARRSEAASLEWRMIDGPRAALPDSKTGPKAIWLGAPVRALLDGLPRTGALVFPGRKGRPTPGRLNRCWVAVRAAAGLDGVRLHDLRHSFAATAMAGREGLRTVAGLLGHSDLTVTAGYAHLDAAPVAEAAARIGEHLGAALDGRRPRKIDLPKSPSAARAQIYTRKPAPAPAPRRPKPEPDPLDRFFAGALDLPAFCAAEGLDEAAFRRRVLAWRKTRRGSRS